MQISSTMDLRQLAERMRRSQFVHHSEAKRMRAALVAGGWDRTEDVPESEWDRMLVAATAAATNQP